MMLKETINRAFEVNLTEGLRFERRMFHSILQLRTKKKACRHLLKNGRQILKSVRDQ